ncbi:BRISC and BRCA1-A complex member 1 isoform X1 [Anomaloglossus baeobatrachus]|uniref:BRISC and BRCA1-A complex member 1 isoform X1 n=1 Tax=Anomaloglossus baeobatrachus TaxID=238106 RepID=UPI003F4F60B9
MDTSEPVEDGERTLEQRPHTRSNPEGAEDKGVPPQPIVGSRSEGEGEAAQAEDPSQPITAPPTCILPSPVEFQVKTPRVNCPEKVIICLDLSEEMSSQKLESFNGSKTNALNSSQKMIEMFVRTKHKIDKRHEFALVVANNEAMWDVFGFFSCLDTKGTSYKYEVSITGPALELHNCMARLLAHPLQRPFQSHASYSLLDEEEETAESEVTV